MKEIKAPKQLRTLYNKEGQDVFDFHEKFLVPMAKKPSLLDTEAVNFRIKFLKEELNEFIDAIAENDLVKAADALVDLVYVALGTALMMGLPWRSLWNRVHWKNMEKRRAKNDGSDSKRGSPLDVVKPAGWTPPDHTVDLGHPPHMVFDATGISERAAAELRAQAANDSTIISVAEPANFKGQP